MKPFEINIRTVYGMRTIGVDHTGLENLCGMLNMPKPMTVKQFNYNSNMLCHAAKGVAEKSMVVAVNDLRKDADVIDIGVSVAGTWQRRGFSSLNGVVAAISIDSGKIVDVEPMSRYCCQCVVNTRLMQGYNNALELWKRSHKDYCKLNHQASAPSMEREGVERIFE